MAVDGDGLTCLMCARTGDLAQAPDRGRGTQLYAASLDFSALFASDLSGRVPDISFGPFRRLTAFLRPRVSLLAMRTCGTCGTLRALAQKEA